MTWVILYMFIAIVEVSCRCVTDGHAPPAARRQERHPRVPLYQGLPGNVALHVMALYGELIKMVFYAN